MTSKVYNYFILTGEPGVGKTTLLKNVTSQIASKNKVVTGFYTQEVRHMNERQGFDIWTYIDGKGNLMGRLATDSRLLPASEVKHKIGKYAVFPEEFADVALGVMKMAEGTTLDLLSMDEIGKMELLSKPFEDAVKNIFDTPPYYSVLATVPLKCGHPLVKSIKNNRRAKVWTVTRANRTTVENEVLAEINKAIHFM